MVFTSLEKARSEMNSCWLLKHNFINARKKLLINMRRLHKTKENNTTAQILFHTLRDPFLHFFWLYFTRIMIDWIIILISHTYQGYTILISCTCPGPSNGPPDPPWRTENVPIFYGRCSTSLYKHDQIRLTILLVNFRLFVCHLLPCHRPYFSAAHGVELCC